MNIECDVGGCCSLPTERADCASFAVGSAARRASRRRGASSSCALSAIGLAQTFYSRRAAALHGACCVSWQRPQWWH